MTILDYFLYSLGISIYEIFVISVIASIYTFIKTSDQFAYLKFFILFVISNMIGIKILGYFV